MAWLYWHELGALERLVSAKGLFDPMAQVAQEEASTDRVRVMDPSANFVAISRGFDSSWDLLRLQIVKHKDWWLLLALALIGAYFVVMIIVGARMPAF
jgi:hypothetical protein